MLYNNFSILTTVVIAKNSLVAVVTDSLTLLKGGLRPGDNIYSKQNKTKTFSHIFKSYVCTKIHIKLQLC